MNKELFMKSINDDLEKMRQSFQPHFSGDDILILLKLLARYNREQEGSNVINLVNKLDLLVGDLEKLGEKDAYMYIVDFIKNNWK